MRRIRDLWTDDPGRQALVAFIAAFLAVGAAAAVIFSVAPSSGSPYCATLDDCRDYIEAERASSVARGRYAAEREAEERAQLLGASAAERDLPNLLASGTREEGYALAYDDAWNDAVDQLTRRQPRQMLAGEDGTQWIELLR